MFGVSQMTLEDQREHPVSVKYNATHQLTTAMMMTTTRMMTMLTWCGILRKKRREIKRNCQWGVSRTRWNICKIQCYSPIDDSDGDDDDNDDDVDLVWYPEKKEKRNQEKLPVGCLEDQMEYL